MFSKGLTVDQLATVAHPLTLPQLFSYCELWNAAPPGLQAADFCSGIAPMLQQRRAAAAAAASEATPATQLTTTSLLAMHKRLAEHMRALLQPTDCAALLAEAQLLYCARLLVRECLRCGTRRLALARVSQPTFCSPPTRSSPSTSLRR